MNAHYVTGKIVHQLIKENSPVSYEVILDRLLFEFTHLPLTGECKETGQAYEAALQIFANEYKPKTDREK